MRSEGESIYSAYEIDEIGKRGRIQDALSLALESIRNGVSDSDLFLIGADLAYRLGDLDKASQLINGLLARDPDHINGWILFGRIHLAKGDLVRSDHGRLMAESIFPSIRSVDYEGNGSRQESAENEPTAELRSSGEEISFDTMTFAEICTRQGYYNKALKIYHDLLKKKPHDPELKRRIEDLTKRLNNND